VASTLNITVICLHPATEASDWPYGEMTGIREGGGREGGGAALVFGPSSQIK